LKDAAFKHNSKDQKVCHAEDGALFTENMDCSTLSKELKATLILKCKEYAVKLKYHSDSDRKHKPITRLLPTRQILMRKIGKLSGRA